MMLFAGMQKLQGLLPELLLLLLMLMCQLFLLNIKVTSYRQ